MNPPSDTAVISSRHAAAALSLTAFALLAALVIQAVNPWTPSARAEMTAKLDSFAAMSTESGNEELVWVIDDRSETLFVYRSANNNRAIEFVDRQSLPEMFAAARQQSGG